MIWNEIKTIESSKKTLRKFGITVGALFLLLGFLYLYKGSPASVYFIYPGGLLITFGVLFPKALLPIQKIWMTAALLIGWVMTRVILSIIFYGLITPMAVAARLSGKKFIETNFQNLESYWAERDIKRTKEDYEKQY